LNREPRKARTAPARTRIVQEKSCGDSRNGRESPDCNRRNYLKSPLFMTPRRHGFARMIGKR
jgi:hypothetical protein